MMRSIILAVPLAVLLAGCAAVGIGPPAGPVAPEAPLVPPPMPPATGPLQLRVIYPREGALIEARDSSFIFGSTGHGGAILRIDGVEVPVHPNGSFLAFLPVPSGEAPRFELIATVEGDSARLEHPVRVLPPRPVLARDGPLVVDTASLSPADVRLMPAEEDVRISVRAPRNATVRLSLATGGTRPMLSASALPAGVQWGDPDRFVASVPARLLDEGATVHITRGDDSVRLAVAPIATIPAGTSRWVALNPARVAGDTDHVVSARPTLSGTNRWLLLPGTRLELTGEAGEQVRVRLDAGLQGWIAAAEVEPLPDGTPPPVRIARSMRVAPGREWVELVIPMAEPPAHFVDAAADAGALTLTLYDTRSEIDNVRYAGADDFISLVDWEQESDRRLRITVRTRHPALGYLALWRDGAFVLRVRRPPAVDRREPLRGLVIAVDAGHPPGGATGPTGLYEADAVLRIAEHLRELLEARGATVVMTRTTREPVALYDRAPIARRAGAHALVSIHLNALPDGVNPFVSHGTSTYFFHPHSAPLARAVQEGMLVWLGLRDIGVFRGDLALVRPTWMPAVLAEGAFIMIPEQEWLIRTREGQEAYARGVADGLERFFRELGGDR